MIHVAIMNKTLHLTEKILRKEKIIESRWYKHKFRPWDNIEKDDIIYIKNTGEPVSVYAKVSQVKQFKDLTPEKVYALIIKYHNELGFDIGDIPFYYEKFKDKKYCIFVFLKRVKKITPFKISKAGFGNQSAWISTNSLEDIKLCK